MTPVAVTALVEDDWDGECYGFTRSTSTATGVVVRSMTTTDDDVRDASKDALSRWRCERRAMMTTMMMMMMMMMTRDASYDMK